MNITSKIGDIVALNYKSASIFRKYKIDFCCGGGKTLEAVCKAKSIDISHVLSDLASLGNSTTQNNEFKEWTLSQLIDHILEHHHTYAKNTIIDLNQYLRKLAKVHGNHNPELNTILNCFDSLATELVSHMKKEEAVLFPYIKQMEDCKNQNIPLPVPHFGTVNNPINMMEKEHESSGDFLSEIRECSNDFKLPGHACNTYTVCFKLLEEFEQDIHKHIHLENNTLFPKAIDLEKELQTV